MQLTKKINLHKIQSDLNQKRRQPKDRCQLPQVRAQCEYVESGRQLTLSTRGKIFLDQQNNVRRVFIFCNLASKVHKFQSTVTKNFMLTYLTCLIKHQYWHSFNPLISSSYHICHLVYSSNTQIFAKKKTGNLHIT